MQCAYSNTNSDKNSFQSTKVRVLLLQPFHGSLYDGRDNPGELVPEVHFAIFWIFWCKMKIMQAALHNLPNLSWLGTGTKYAGLHTQWLLVPVSKSIAGSKTVLQQKPPVLN